MVAEAAGAAASVRGHRTKPTGRLQVNAAIGLGAPVAAVMIDMARALPQLRFDLRLEDRYANLLEEDVDVAVRGGKLDDSGLIVRKVATAVHVVCAAPAYLLSRGVPRSPGALGGHDWVIHDNSPRRLTARRRGRVVSVIVNSRLQANSGLAVLQLVRAGQGLVLAPMWEVMEDLRAGTLQVVLPGWQLKTSAVYVVSLAGRHRLPKVMEFTGRIARRLGQAGWDRIEPSWNAGGAGVLTVPTLDHEADQA